MSTNRFLAMVGVVIAVAIATMAAQRIEACREKGGDTVRIGEDHHCGDLTGDTGEQNWAPSDMVGEPSSSEQGGEQRDGVHAEDNRGGE